MSRPPFRIVAGAAALLPAFASAAFLYWARPVFPSGPVVGDEPGIALPLAGAKPDEVSANLLWAMRAGLNVAALQCQFAPGLMTVHYYNDILRHHGAELDAARVTLTNYFKRLNKKGYQADFDGYTTRTYNGFSTFHAQFGFCEEAAAIGRDAMTRPRGQLIRTAQAYMRAFRGSLVPVGDTGLRPDRTLATGIDLPPADLNCYDRKERAIDCDTGKRLKLPLPWVTRHVD